MKYRVTHRTVYKYTSPVTVSHHAARLKPRFTDSQDRDAFALHIEPAPNVRKMRTDYFGNRVCFFSIQEIHSRLEVVATSEVTVKESTPPALGLSPDWQEVRNLFTDPVAPEMADPYQFVFDSPLLTASPELADYTKESFPAGTPILVGAEDLNRRIHEDFKFDPRATTVSTPLEEVWAKRRGVCQDFAHLGIACLRSIGLAARYVSGYLRTLPAAGRERLVGADYSHAWFSVFSPGYGWVEFDPTNNVIPGPEHIVIAFGRDFSDVSPVSGIITGGGKHEVLVGVDVEPI